MLIVHMSNKCSGNTTSFTKKSHHTLALPGLVQCLLCLSYGFPSSVLYCYGGISQNALGSNLGHLVSVRRSGDCEPGEGFVKICCVKEKNVWEQEESTCARKMTRMVLG